MGSGQADLASQHNDRRDDSRASSFLFAHQMLGSLALSTVPTNGQVVPIVINGTTITITAVTSIGSTANNVLIGGSAAAFVTNLVNFLRRPDLTTSTAVASSGANQTLLQYCGYAWPGSSTNIVIFSLNKNVNGLTGPLSSFSASTTTSGNSWTAATLKLYVEDGTYYVNGTRYLFTGGSTPAVTAPSSYPRIDVLTIDTSGTLAWTTGSENVSPVAPTYPANKLAICELYNVVSETALYDNENQQSGQGYILNDVRPSMSYGIPFGAVPDSILPATNNTYALGSASYQWSAIYGEYIYVNGAPVAGAKFGGTGSDGALSITSGATNINLGNAPIVVKNYTSVSITGSAYLTFTNPASGGTLFVMKSQGNVTITTSATSAIVLVGVGGAGGATPSSASSGGNSGSSFGIWIGQFNAGGGGGGGGNTGAGGGGGGASASTSGSNGSNGGNGTTGGTSLSPFISSSVPQYIKMMCLPGSGGGSGGNGFTYSSQGGAGGAGGGSLYVECAGALNVTSTISAAGTNGSNQAGGNGGGGGGGAGGCIVILYTTLTANSGTYTVSGGSAGTGSTSYGAGGAGASGFSLIAKNTEFT